ncbi:zinc ribbon domain-containing protein [Halapricum salinum]|uniref:Zinc ribbon domain-containing protein n=1 Tax=Halapricum salinum TaxID=1457250 RepID=A0A4D6HDT1_9EURY|nr:zinc ribbon domain-containing protein [Halapricum salinum]QCC51406.1 zinc ribbon domain-containing protein [Halapricum salinum]
MVYCQHCGEQIAKTDRYCSGCGRKQEQRSSKEPLEEFFSKIDRLVDRQVDWIATKYPDIEQEILLDEHTFAMQMYVIGLLKGQIGTLILLSADDWDDTDRENIDLDPIYSYLVDTVQEREGNIREALNATA